ncbi:hypothetical protein MTBBW1_1200026 [Desulfamplus magnetovallimortis]|uniref:Uncharacterized protein n=1 Tax=Desulfamplus magnetovallimortis TaxID=1246637 RepID=A0A1W1H640_9BACT|nr:hypothetical protein MTBBW1_1200026 [Desulfamplus magnetovallimortis]
MFMEKPARRALSSRNSSNYFYVSDFLRDHQNLSLYYDIIEKYKSPWPLLRRS